MKKSALMASLFGMVFTLSAYAHQFNWENLMISAMKLNPHFDYETYVDSYMELFRPEVWSRYKNDEFELEEKRKQTIEIMKKQADNFSLEEEFVALVREDFGDYNFEKEEFPVRDTIGGNFFLHKDNRRNGAFPGKFKVLFENPEVFGGLDLPPAEAKRFLAQRKDSRGNVDRTVYILIKFRITDLTNFRDEFKGELTEVTFYADKSRAKMLTKHEAGAATSTRDDAPE